MTTHSRLSSVFTALLVLGLSVPASADQATYRVASGKVSFESDAPLETIKGKGSKVIGKVTFDAGDLSTIKGEIKVPVGSLGTANDLRDEHLHGKKWLDSQKFPFAVFKIDSVSGAKALKAGKATKVKVKGTFKIHGVTKPMVAKATVKLSPAGDLNVKTKFVVNLTDHKVKVPSIVRLKVANEIDVVVDFKARGR